MPTMKTTGKNKKPKIEPPVFDADGYQTNIKDLNGTPLPDLSKVQAVSFWGGAREGAGRKSTGRQPVLLRLTPKTVRSLRASARKEGKTISEVAEARLVLA
jgi:hypothetical protein